MEELAPALVPLAVSSQQRVEQLIALTSFSNLESNACLSLRDSPYPLSLLPLQPMVTSLCCRVPLLQWVLEY